jgi:hypothetical protein
LLRCCLFIIIIIIICHKTRTYNTMPRRPRQSFGGNNGTGIFWRKRFCDEDQTSVTNANPACDDLPLDDDDDDAAAAAAADGGPPVSFLTATEEEVSIKWDDELCRPIYIRSEGENRNSAMVVTSEGDEEDHEDSGDTSSLCSDNKDHAVTTASAEETTVVPFVLPEVLQNARTRGRKRHKTFGDRDVVRRPLSLILSEHQQDEEDQSLNDSENGQEPINKRQRSIHMDSLATLVPVSSTGRSRRVSASPVQRDSTDQNDAFAFPVESDSVGKYKTLLPLERAREFFEELDKTQKLTVDASFSPPVSGRVVRTSRRVDYSSPRVNQEYQAYVEATASTGVTPLTIRDFVKSRRLQFETRGGELFDGFLDDC